MSVSIARADTIQLAHNEELTVIFAIPGYNPSNPGTIFPTTIGLELAGYVPSGTLTSAIPGSTGLYYSGLLLEGSLESLDGSLSLPLFDANAWRLGLPTGDIVSTAGYGGGAIAYGEVAVSLNASEQLFGTAGQAEFVIKNVGGDLTIGLGPGYSISNAIIATLGANNGQIQTSGYMVSLQTSTPSDLGGGAVPEPATIGVAAVGGALLFWLRKRLRPGAE